MKFPLCVVLGGVLGLCHAADRDPTLPPAAVSAAPGASAPGAPAPALAAQMHGVLVQDGQPRLVVGTRLYAVGQTVGTARLERITETEVWLREGKRLHKLPRFAGIQRRTHGPCPANVAPVKSAALCEDTQP
ncbi:MAG: hypothetical protein QE265_12960 [Rhodoferax sp.]|nr:hypothetical protein [Rhodoferax sp.]